MRNERSKRKGRIVLQYPDHPRLRLVKDQIIDLIVAMNERRPVLRLRAPGLEESHYVVEMRDFTDGHVRLNVDGLRL